MVGKGKKIKRTSSARLDAAKVSFKHAMVLCKELRKKKVGKAKGLLEDLIERKRSLEGKYYTNASKNLLAVLKSAEANAMAKGLDTERLFVAVAKADKGRTFIRPKSRFKSRGRRMKSTNIEIVLEER